MAYTLFERIVLNDNDDPAFEKIAVRFIRTVAMEIHLGRLTPTDVIVKYSLTPSQQGEWVRFLTLMQAHPAKSDFAQEVFGWLICAEHNLFPQYRDEAAFWAMMEASVVNAGGTVPA